MGTFFVECKITNLKEGSRFAIVPKLMVDTGSEYTWVPELVLNQIGVQVVKTVRMVTANGALLERKAGYAQLNVDPFETVDQVVFAQEGDLLLLGARTLEGFNVRVDPMAKKLLNAGPIPAATICGHEGVGESEAYRLKLEEEFLAAKERLPRA